MFLPKTDLLELLLSYSAQNLGYNDTKYAFVAICSGYHKYSTVL